MPQPKIKFIKGKGGLSRPLPGQDYISSLIFYTANLPSGYSPTNRVQQLFQPADAITYGILNDYSDATPAVAEYLITADGAVGDNIIVSVNDIDGNGQNQNTVLCNYTRTTADSTIALLGADIAAAINSGTLIHGYIAFFAIATLTVTAPKKFGIFLNSGSPLVVTIVGTIAGTITQFASGVFSEFAFWYYQIEEFFRVQPGGYLYTGFFAVPGSYNFAEVNTIQNFSGGVIRQVGVMKGFASAWATGDMTALSNACVVSDNVHKPLSALYSADLTGTADISTITDLNSLSANKTSPIIAMDGGARGWFLFRTSGKSVPALGAALGAAALAKVSESIGWVDKFDMSDGNELEVVAFSNGQQLSSAAISDNLLDTINDRRYIFLKKYVGKSGSYFNGGHCAISVSSDYAYLENNRTIDKAIRGIYLSLLPSLNGPIQLNLDGTLTENTAASFEDTAAVNLAQMVRDGELSGQSCVVNPAQNVLQTDILVVSVSLLINGVAREIDVPIGFVPKIA